MFFKKLDELADLNSSRFHAIESHKMLIAWVFAIVVIVSLGFFFHGQRIVFSGIAEASETTVSVQQASEVVKVHVISGQEVKAGDTLVELNRPDIAMRMNDLSRQLDVIEGRGNISSASIDQKVAEVQAELVSKRNALHFEIEKLKIQYEQNKALSAKLKSLPANTVDADSNSGILLNIRNLKKEVAVAEQAAASQIALLRGSKGLEKTSSAQEADALRREMKMLKDEQKDLTIIAKDSWVVASVDVRDGEKISSFTPIVTLTHKAPSMIRGYINEKVYTRIMVGDAVDVIAGNGEHMAGVVMGMSSRIVPYPLRLLKMPDMPMYGREVTISVPSKNSLLLGEKVSIAELSKMPKLLKASAMAGGNE